MTRTRGFPAVLGFYDCCWHSKPPEAPKMRKRTTRQGVKERVGDEEIISKNDGTMGRWEINCEQESEARS